MFFCITQLLAKCNTFFVSVSLTKENLREWEKENIHKIPAYVEVIIEKSRGEGSLMEQDTIENVS